MAHHFGGLGEDELDQARVLVALFGQATRRRGWRHLAQVDAAVFRLGDDLLGDDQHVAILELAVRRPDRIEDQVGQVVAGLDQRHAGQRQQFYCPRVVHAPSAHAPPAPPP